MSFFFNIAAIFAVGAIAVLFIPAKGRFDSGKRLEYLLYFFNHGKGKFSKILFLIQVLVTGSPASSIVLAK